MVSTVALVALAPLMLTIAILLRFTGEGEILFKQKRIGKACKTFYLIKFATMLKNSASVGAGEVTLTNDPRVLPVGRLLRKSKLNELPQLINILKGDMSLIGYRPQTQKYWNCFTKAQQEILSNHRPGLSGVSSILLRDEESYLERFADPIFADENLLMPFKGQVEKWYAENASFSTYIQLILMTVVKIIAPKLNSYLFMSEQMAFFQKELDDIVNSNV